LHAFGPIGRTYGVAPFHHYWVRGLKQGLLDSHEPYTLAAVAARQLKYGRPSPQRHARTAAPAIGGLRTDKSLQPPDPR
jgi:tryptophan halogenase